MILEWRSMDTAPRDGTIVELKCTYGVAPWFGLHRWTNEMSYIIEGERKTYKVEHPTWVKVAESCFCSTVSDESSLSWRPYESDPKQYIDPTRGAQNDPAYWRAATAKSYGLRADYFEPKKKNFLRRWLDRIF